MAIEIVSFPIKNGDFHSFLYVYQRVNHENPGTSLPIRLQILRWHIFQRLSEDVQGAAELRRLRPRQQTAGGALQVTEEDVEETKEVLGGKSWRKSWGENDPGDIYINIYIYWICVYIYVECVYICIFIEHTIGGIMLFQFVILSIKYIYPIYSWVN